jgi:probable HAF family extracellular repeat protein
VAINNNGDVIGAAMNASGVYVGFVSHNGGPLISLGTLPGSWESQPESINDKGQMVGAALGQPLAHPSSFSAPGNGGAFLYQDGTLMDLNKLLSPSASDITLVDAYAINNAGQIVAQGFLKGQIWPELQVFLLTPAGQPVPSSPNPLIQTVPQVPEPTSLAIFGLMLAGICTRRLLKE